MHTTVALSLFTQTGRRSALRLKVSRERDMLCPLYE